MPVPDGHGVHRRELLRDNVYVSIRDAIVDGTFAPGERLRDADLEQWLGVSRTPIREALLRLEAAGLVASRPGHSTIVTPIDDGATREAQEIAAALQELAMRLAAPHLRDADLVAMREANRRFADALDDEDVEGALAADDDFHAVAVERSGNAMLRLVLDQASPLLRRVERIRFGSLAGRDSVAVHERIIDLAAAGDGERAAVAVRHNWHALADVLAEPAADA